MLSSVLLLVAAFIWVKFSGKTADKYVFGKVFTNIQFCSVQEFQYLPNNTCLSDTRTFTTEHKKINLSFESAVPIDQGATFTLQWLRNGILQMEKPRPWLKAFAFEYKYASTHIKMVKRDGLPEEWADPGRYHVRFFVDGILVDEVRFDIVESLSS